MEVIRTIDEAVKSVRKWNEEQREYDIEKLDSLLIEVKPIFNEIIEVYPLPWNKMDNDEISEMYEYSDQLVKKYFTSTLTLKNMHIFALMISECLSRDQFTYLSK